MDFSAHPVGIGFRMFGAAHLVVLGIVLAANLALVPLRRVLSERGRRFFRLGLAALIAVMFMAHVVWRIHVGFWDVRSDLPLHLCDLTALLSFALLLSRSRWLYDFVYFLGVGGALQALVTSNVGIYGFPHLYFLTSMVIHGAIITTGIYFTVVEGFRPTWRTLWRVAGCMLAYTGVIFGLNLLIGSNYLFIARRPDFPSLIDELGPWPWYVLSLIGVGLASLFILYVPFALKDWWSRARGGGGAQLSQK
ncbi:TIGR02206 family membrane protein [Hyalangium sp.]|uniref:YwaF family protein n=1 Tax=Hyalangium sp. TaxID=2028555 RepID=UPI002D513C3C|nr:TIGR02206 family membrane protein [Hyalangium sp.]HYH97316.1 TIGR02206 family membrane protein [Hyalangium sp.]